MSRVIAYNIEDTAGKNMADILICDFDFKANGEKNQGINVYKNNDVYLVGFDDFLLYQKEIPYDPEVVIVASRHRSESGKPTLTAHVTGNFNKAEYGGEPNALGVAPAHFLSKGLELLHEVKQQSNLDYPISFEVTHHGPTIDTPMVFMEVGSTENQWNDKDACRAVANAIFDLSKFTPIDQAVGVGFGGTHYAPNLSLVKNMSLGHMMPKHACEYLDEEMFLKMVERTTPKPTHIVLDWKGLKGVHKNFLKEMSEKHRLEIIRTRDLKEK